jgi:hypothetical protein
MQAMKGPSKLSVVFFGHGTQVRFGSHQGHIGGMLHATRDVLKHQHHDVPTGSSVNSKGLSRPRRSLTNIIS